MVVAAAAPLTVVGGVFPLGYSMGNGLGFPLAYVLASGALILFSIGMAQMARVVPKPGAFYTYIRDGLGQVAGTVAAFIAAAAYVCSPVGTVAFIGLQLNISVLSLGGPDIPWWIYSAPVMAVVAVLGYRSIDLTARMLGVLLVAEFLIITALLTVVFVTGGESGLTTEPLKPSALFSGNFGLALMFAIIGFLGYEATAVYRDEAKDPDRTIPRATYAAVIVVGLFYTITAYGLIVAWGPERIVEESQADPAGMLVATTHHYLGTAGEIIAQSLLITSIFASILAFHNVCARYLHSMAGDGMIPARLNSVHATHGSPHKSSLIVSGVITGGVTAAAIIGLDPTTEVLAWSGALVAAGIIILMILTGIAVPVYFHRNPQHRVGTSVWTTSVAPLAGTLCMVIAEVLLLVNFPFMVGGSPLLAYSLLSIIPIAGLAGFFVALSNRRRQRISSQT